MERNEMTRRLAGGVAAAAALVAFAWVIYANAWICDDSFILLRTVDNFTNGFGLRWNADERVQVFTCPLWTLLLAGLVAVTRESYMTAVAGGALLSLAAYLIILRRFLLPRGPWAVAGFTLLLLLSKAFIDYSTSGIENPLSYLLVVLFCAVFLRGERRRWDLGKMSLLASLLALSHPDLILLVLPPLIMTARGTPREERPLRQLFAGAVPLLAWLGFAYLYYGSILPNSAWAKLNSEMSLLLTARQGGLYLLDSFLMDPLTLLTVAGGVALALATKRRELAALAIGHLLFLGYVVLIGGDFMSGRLLSVPFLVAFLTLAAALRPAPRPAIALGASVLLVGFLSPHPPPLSGKAYGAGESAVGQTTGRWGIADERGFWYRLYGLRPVLSRPDHSFFDPRMWRGDAPDSTLDVIQQLAQNLREGRRVLIIGGGGGIFGYLAGRNAHLVDELGVCDPLISRIPFRPDPARGRIYRPGHLRRELPEGYPDSIAEGRNMITDKKIARLYDRVLLMTRAPLFSRERLLALLSGGY